MGRFSLAISAQLLDGSSAGILGRAVAFVSYPSTASDLRGLGDGKTEGDMVRSGLDDRDRLDGLRRRSAGSRPQDRGTPSSAAASAIVPVPIIIVLAGAGLSMVAGVGSVSILCCEKTDEVMLLSVRLCSRLRFGVCDRLIGVTGRGNLEPEPLDRRW